MYGTPVYENAASVSKQPEHVIAPQNESVEGKRLWWTRCRGEERFPADSLFVVTFITSSCCWEYYVCTSHLMWNIRELIRIVKNSLNVWPMKIYDWRNSEFNEIMRTGSVFSYLLYSSVRVVSIFFRMYFPIM